MKPDESSYAMVAEEIPSGRIDRTLWTKAFAQSGGEETATKSLYCRLRAEQLHDAKVQQKRSAQISHSKTHGKQVGFGLLAFFVGVGLTGVSYSATKPGGHYIATFGLIIGGLSAFCKGLWGLLKTPFVETTAVDHSTRQSSPVTKSVAGGATATAASPQAGKKEESQTGCLILAGVGLLILILSALGGNSPRSPPATTNTAPVAVVESTPPDQRAELVQKLTDLDSEYRSLSARRAALDVNNRDQVALFNRDAADYTFRMKTVSEWKDFLERLQ